MRFFNAYRVVNRTAVSPVNQTSLLVAGASRLGLPVSTTHVAVGALFGIGLINGTARARTILTILTAWVTTLPISAALAAATYLFLWPLL